MAVLGELNSFRGRKYAPFLLYVIRCDLYQEVLEVSAIQQIASALRVYLAQHQGAALDTLVWRSAAGWFFDITFYDLQELVVVFDFAATHQFTLFSHS